MNNQRYLLARFTPDVRRREPRNIGVVLWTKHRVVSQFLPADQASRVGTNKDDLAQWSQFWSGVCNHGAKVYGRRGSVKTSDPKILDLLIETGRGQFQLLDGGFVTEPIAKADVEAVLTSLYSSLVEVLPDDCASGRRTALNRLCADVFALAGLNANPRFTTNFRVPCRIGNAHRKFPVNYLIGGDDGPTGVFQRVIVSDERSVDSASYMFEWIAKEFGLTRDCFGALFHSGCPAIDGVHDQLQEHCIPVDVAERNSAVATVLRIASHSSIQSA